MALLNLFPAGGNTASYSGGPQTQGIEFRLSAQGWLTEIRAYKPANVAAPTAGAVWTVTGTLVAGTQVTMPAVAANYAGWVTAVLPTPVKLNAGNYRIGVRFPGPVLQGSSGYFQTNGITNGILSAPNRPSATDGKQSVYTAASALTFPNTGSGSGAGYFVEPTISDVDPTPPATPLSSRTADFSTDPTASLPVSYGFELVNGRGRLNATNAGNGTTTYSGRKTADQAQGANSFDAVWLEVTQLPAADPGGAASPAMVWVQAASQPAGTRIGFEYDPRDGKLYCRAQVGYGNTSELALTYDPVAHRWWKLTRSGDSILWQTSPDGTNGSWTTRATQATAPAWTAGNDLSVAIETYRTTGPNDFFEFDNFNVVGTAAPVIPLPTGPTTGADAFQRRNLAELRAWKAWLDANGAQGFVGEHGHVTHWAQWGDAAQAALWKALLDNYVTETDWLRIHGAYWASGREWGNGYPMGMHVGTNAGDALSISFDGSDVLAQHPTRLGVNRGVNLAGWEKGVTTTDTPGTIRSEAGYVHTAADFAYLKSQGVNLVRLPIPWEKLQPTLNGALDTGALTTLDGMLTAAANNGIAVVLDLHNYARYTTAGNTVSVLGGALTTANLSDFWVKLSTWVKANGTRNAAVVAYGLMNEPHDMPTGAAGWEAASQAVLTAIRNNTDNRLIYVAGYTWSSLVEWATWHPDGWITDPANNFRYEAHHYWDTTSISPRSGTYTQASTGTATTYATELAAAQAWEAPPALSDSGSVTSYSDGSSSFAGTHAGTGLPTSSESSGTGTVAGTHAGTALPSDSASDGSGSGVGSHTGQGTAESLSDGFAEGEQIHGGHVDSETDGSGSFTAGHSGSGAVDSTEAGTAGTSGSHVGTGVPVDSSTTGTAAFSGQHKGTGQPNSSLSETTGEGYAEQVSSAGIARPIIGMAVRLFDANGNRAEFLPHWTSIAYTDQNNGAGTVAIEYARDGLFVDKLLSDRAEGALFDGERELWGTRFLVTQSSTDAVKEDVSGRTLTLNCPAYVPTRLSEATVYPDRWPQTQNKQLFSAVTPGEIIGRLIQQAQNRGAIPDVDTGFSAAVDSDGGAWSNLVTMEVDPGGSIMAVLEKLTEMGVCNWTSSGRELQMYNPELVDDRTIGPWPVVLQAGRDILDAPEKRDAQRILTNVLVTGKDGIAVEVEDTPARQRHGRLEGFVSVSNVEDKGTLRVIGEATLKRSALPLESFTHELALFADNGPQPWVDYQVGSWVYRDVADGKGPQRYQVAQLSATYAQDGTVTGQVTLGTRFDSIAQKLSARIDALTNGNEGKSAPAESPAEDRIPPETPTGLLVTSDAYTIDEVGNMAAVSAAWTPVVENVDGSDIRDFDRYQIRWRDMDSIPGSGAIGDTDLADAARELLSHINAGGTFFEDFTFRGCSANLNNRNDDLADGYNGDFEVDPIKVYLQQVINANRPSTVTAYWTLAGEPRDPSQTWSPVPCGIGIAVQVRAIDRFGNASGWSPEVYHLTASDNTPPEAPSKPTVSNYLGQLRVYWDGLSATAVSMAADLKWVEVHYGTTAGFTPSAATLVDTLTGTGTTVIPGLTYGQLYTVKLVAVDLAGNRSAVSASATGTPTKLVNIDLGPNAVERLQIKDGEIVTAKIADLAVNDAKIANLSVGKLTAGTMSADVIVAGSFNTSTDANNRIRVDSTGIHAYRNGDLRVDIRPDGTALLTGEMRTANSGMRLVWNAGQSRASIQFHSNATTTDTAPSLYVAANTTNANRPAVILDGPMSSRDPALITGLVIGDRYAQLCVRTKAAGDSAVFEGFYVREGTNFDQWVRAGGTSGRLVIMEALSDAPSGLKCWNIECNSITYSGALTPVSAEHTKEDFTTASGLEVLRNAPVYAYKKRPVMSTEKHIYPAPETPWTQGPVAEDLPAWLQRTIDDDVAGKVQGYDLHSYIATIAQAVRELDEELDGFRDKAKRPRRATDRDKKRIGRL